MKKQLLFLTGMLSFLGGWYTTAVRGAEPARFDHLVRNDFFAGFSGNMEALKRGMEVTERVLSENPNHAEAMVWHGAGLFAMSGTEFRQGNQQKGMELWGKGLCMMDKAVELAPDHIGVRIPRGATLLTASRMVPPDFQKELLKRAASDYEKAYDLQKNSLDKMGTHARGELLIGLADAYERLGQAEQSKEMLGKLVSLMPETVYGRNAKTWLAPSRRRLP